MTALLVAPLSAKQQPITSIQAVLEPVNPNRSPVIDAHKHFWHYDPSKMLWVKDMPLLQRNFLPEDIRPEMGVVGIDGLIAVQADDSYGETSFLCDLAKQHPDIVYGVVGWADLTGPNLDRILETLKEHHPSLVGIRQVRTQESDPGKASTANAYMLSPEFNRGIAALTKAGLAYDVLIYSHQLPAAIDMVSNHPDQRFILDHAGKPDINRGEFDQWRTHMSRLGRMARQQPIYVKLSGLITEAGPDWRNRDIAGYVEQLRMHIHPTRMMFGSDHPVLLHETGDGGYAMWVAKVKDMIQSFPKPHRERIMGGTAAEAYKLMQGGK